MWVLLSGTQARIYSNPVKVIQNTTDQKDALSYEYVDFSFSFKYADVVWEYKQHYRA